MSVQTISLLVEPKTQKTGQALVTETIDPEIAKFEDWFSKPKHGNSRLTPMEREVLRSFLYQKITGVL